MSKIPQSASSYAYPKKQEQIGLLGLEKSNIHVSEYLTILPPKELLEQWLHLAVQRAKRRFE